MTNLPNLRSALPGFPMMLVTCVNPFRVNTALKQHAYPEFDLLAHGTSLNCGRSSSNSKRNPCCLPLHLPTRPCTPICSAKCTAPGLLQYGGAHVCNCTVGGGVTAGGLAQGDVVRIRQGQQRTEPRVRALLQVHGVE